MKVIPSVDEQFAKFDKGAIPETASDAQREAMRVGFYSGAAAMSDIFTRVAKDPLLTNSGRNEHLKLCMEQLEAFFVEIQNSIKESKHG